MLQGTSYLKWHRCQRSARSLSILQLINLAGKDTLTVAQVNMANSGCVLYSFPPLPNPQKARLALEEFGVPYTVHNVNVIAGENLAPFFLENVNSNGTVPALVINLNIGRKVVTESKEIVLNAFTRTRRGPISNAAPIHQWVDDFDAWNGPLYTLANDAVLKRLVLSVNA